MRTICLHSTSFQGGIYRKSGMRSTACGKRFTGVSRSKTPDARPGARMRSSACRPGSLKKSTFRLRLTFAFARHSGESRNPFLPLSLSLRPDVLASGRGRYGRRHIYPLHPFRIRAQRALQRVGIKCENENKNHKMDSGFRRNDGGFPASRGFSTASYQWAFLPPPHRGASLLPPCQGGRGVGFVGRDRSRPVRGSPSSRASAPNPHPE